MLFSIYSASLIALSSAGEGFERSGMPAGQTNCKLYVAVDGVGMGWVKATKENTLTTTGTDTLTTTGTESKAFGDGALFEFDVGEEDGSFGTLQIKDETVPAKEISLNTAKKLLSLQVRNTPEYTVAAWAAPEVDFDERPTELIIESGQKELPVQYCTSNDGGKPAILSVVGDDGYECKKATIFVRFIYTSVEKFPQKAKIAVYKKEKLEYMGWLFLSADKTILECYNNHLNANEVSLQGEAGNTRIYWGEKTIHKPVDPTGDLTYDKGDSQIFQWANGNPQQILPSGATTLYRCARKDKSKHPPSTFHAEKPTDEGVECFEVLWILAVTG